MARYTGSADDVMSALVAAGFNFRAKKAAKIKAVVEKLVGNSPSLSDAIALNTFSASKCAKLDKLLGNVAAANAISPKEAAQIGKLFRFPILGRLSGVGSHIGSHKLRYGIVATLLLVVGSGYYFRSNIGELFASKPTTEVKTEVAAKTNGTEALSSDETALLTSYLANNCKDIKVGDLSVEAQRKMLDKAKPQPLNGEEKTALSKYLAANGGLIAVDDLSVEKQRELLAKAPKTAAVPKKTATKDEGPKGGDTEPTKEAPKEWTPFRVASDSLVEQIDAVTVHQTETGKKLVAVKGQVTEVKKGLQAAETALGELTTRHETESKALVELKTVATAMRKSDEDASTAAREASERIKKLLAAPAKKK